jgi:ABC-type methionine transport system permease subunit
MLIGVLALIGAYSLKYEECARLINFGAFLAFMGVNLAVIREYFFKSEDRSVRNFFLNFLPPSIGFVICLIIWLNLPLKTFIIGGSWMLAGILYLAIRTRGFRQRMVMIDFSEV